LGADPDFPSQPLLVAELLSLLHSVELKRRAEEAKRAVSVYGVGTTVLKKKAEPLTPIFSFPLSKATDWLK
jgi:hypothetical protein